MKVFFMPRTATEKITTYIITKEERIMKEGYDPKSINRSILLRLLRDRRVSLGEKLKIVEPMRGKSDEEKERTAANLILDLLSRDDQNP